MAWWSRPVYPVLLTAPLLVVKSLAASIWMSRLALIVTGPIIGAFTLNRTGSYVAASVAGFTAVAQPLTLLAEGPSSCRMAGSPLPWSCSGGRSPCGNPRSQPREALVGRRRCGLHVRGPHEGDGSPWVPARRVDVVGHSSAPAEGDRARADRGAGAGTYIASVLTAGPTTRRLVELPGALLEALRQEAFGGSYVAVVVTGVLVVALVCWAVPRATEPLPLLGLILIASGTGLLLYASGAGLGVRNGAFVPCGVAFLLGGYVAYLESCRERVRRVVGIAASAGLVLSLVTGSVVLAASRPPPGRQGWNIAASEDLTRWLSDHAGDARVGCTLQYCSYLWLASEGRLGSSCSPSTPPGSETPLRSRSCAGPKASASAAGAPPHHRARAGPSWSPGGREYGAIFECALLRYVRREQPKYLVVSGWGTLTFDAGALVPYLEVSPAFKRVYLRQPADEKWFQVMAVYKVVDDHPQPLPKAPTYYSSTAYAALPEARDEGGSLLDPPCFTRLMNAIQPRPTDYPSLASLPPCDPTAGAGQEDDDS